MEFTADTLKSAVCRKLKDVTEGFTIYKNTPSKGTKLPCFFVSQKSVDSVRLGKGKYENEYLIIIRYHDVDVNESINDNMALFIQEQLDLIEWDGMKFVPLKLSSVISDGVLQVLATFKIRIFKPEDNPSMGNIEFK